MRIYPKDVVIAKFAQDTFLPQSVGGVEDEIGTDCVGAVAEQDAKMMHFPFFYTRQIVNEYNKTSPSPRERGIKIALSYLPSFSRFQDECHFHSKPLLDQMMVNGTQSQ
jgi:hypothetical protein